MPDLLTEHGLAVSGSASQRPAGAIQGTRFFNSDIGALEIYDEQHGGWHPVAGVVAEEVSFSETNGAGNYSGSVNLPAGATLLDVIVTAAALWTATTSATMIVGDAADDDGYYTAVNLKAIDLLVGETLSFALAGGKAGAYIANSHVTPRYSASARAITGKITTVGAAGNAGRTRMTVLYALPKVKNATKA
jgi:hypothetical protein